MKLSGKEIDLTPEQFREEVESILGRMVEVLVTKNRDYGNASLNDPLGIVANSVRLGDKFSRLRNLILLRNKGENPAWENLEDTYLDIIGYSVLGLIILKHTEHSEELLSSPSTGGEPFGFDPEKDGV